MTIDRDEGMKILKRMHGRVDFVLSSHKEYFEALAEFDRTGVLKIRGKVLYVNKHHNYKNDYSV